MMDNQIVAMVYESRSKEELAVIAKDIFDGKIFTHHACPSVEDVRMIFMPLALHGRVPKGTGLMFEYLSKASPMKWKDKPTFATAEFLNQADADIVYNLFQKLKQDNPTNDSETKSTIHKEDD